MSTGEHLHGGSMSHVWRDGNTVHREAGPWTPQVHRFLSHLNAAGVVGIPQPLGMDDNNGREIVTYLPGEAGASPLSVRHRSDSVILDAARLLRAIHDATTDVATEWTTGWRVPARHPVEVICHGDFAPYNCVFEGDQLVGVFDFDFAHPGPRTWDLAYALYRFVPLADAAHSEGFGTPAEQGRRMRLFCHAYSLADCTSLVDTILVRIQFMVDFLLEGQAQGDARCIANIEAGHLAVYQHDHAYVECHRAVFEAALA